MICEGSGFPEGDSANAPDFITGRFHDRTYAKIIIILENYTVNHTGSRQGPGSGGTSFQSPAAPSTPALPSVQVRRWTRPPAPVPASFTRLTECRCLGTGVQRIAILRDISGNLY